MWFLVMTAMFGSGKLVQPVGELRFDNRIACEAYKKQAGYDNTPIMRFDCQKAVKL